jgi:ATP-dependent exoDNAse (exonuclease V) beta subunit
VASIEARILGLESDAAARAAHIAGRVLAHDLLARARTAAQAGKCRRETPVSLVLGPRVIEGVVDLAFEEGGRWTVVDYKTDREIAAAGEDRYRRQIALYASAIAQATAAPATGILLRI